MIVLSLYPLPLISYTHDAAAALLSEARIVYAYEEERISRRQHSIATFPEQSAVLALQRAGLAPGDLTEIVVTSMNSCDRQDDYSSKIRYLRELLLIDPKIPVTCVPHHLAHSALSVLTSPYEQCAFVTVDAGGDGFMGHWGVFDRDRFEIRESFGLSPGIFYAYITCLAGFSLFEEGKVMGLSAFGAINERLYQWLRRNFFIRNGKLEMQISKDVRLRWESMILPGRLDPDSPRRHKYYKLGVRFHEERDAGWLSNIPPWDVAATGQMVFEELMLELVRNLVETTNCTNLALSGGALQNVLLVDKLQRLAGIRVHVPIAPHDSGLALGAGLLRIFETTGNRVGNQTHPYLGPSFSCDQVEARIKAFGLHYVERADIPIAAVDEILKGRIVGWFSGKAEFGARSLGARSVLADPRNPTAKSRLNQTLKRRDWFMPYAPSILEERGAEYFEDFYPSPYMNRAFRLRPGKAAEIPSALHVDGSCRAHSVNSQANLTYCVRTHLRTYKSEQKPGGEWLSIIAVGGCGCEYHRRRRVREPQDLVG